MDLVVKARGLPLTDHLRGTAERKLTKIGRIEPRVVRLEVEIVAEHNPRVADGHHVEVACAIPGHTFRADAAAHDVDSALDRVVDRLQRQISSYHGRLHARKTGQRNRLESD